MATKAKPKRITVSLLAQSTELHPELGLPSSSELRACKLCPLAGAGPVPGEAWGLATVMLIGEAPGAMEARTGRPFVVES